MLIPRGDASLPDPAAFAGVTLAPLSVDISFIGDAVDRVTGSGTTVLLHGATVDTGGGNTAGGFAPVTIAGTSYASADASFTIAYWMTKEECTGGIYEYVLHNQNNDAAIDLTSNSNINMYLDVRQLVEDEQRRLGRCCVTT